MEKYLVVFGKWYRNPHAVIYQHKITNNLFEHNLTSVDVDTLNPEDLYPVFKYDSIEIRTKTIQKYDIIKDVFDDNIVDFAYIGRDTMRFIDQRMAEWKIVNEDQ